MKNSLSKIITTLKELITNPKGFWAKQKEINQNQTELLSRYFFPILLVVAFAVFFGEFIRRSDFFIEHPALKALRIIVLFVLQYFISVFFTNELIKTFGGEKNKGIVRQLVVYSLVPFLLVSIVTGLFPFLYVMGILGIYGFYIFWIGATELLTFPENKKQKYIQITIVVNFFVFSFLSVILSQFLKAYY